MNRSGEDDGSDKRSQAALVRIRSTGFRFPDPKPAYSTVSTIVRILESKGFIDHEAFGKTHHYYPKVKKDEYTHFFVNRVVKDYFDNSFQEMVSFFTQDQSISLSELEEMLSLIQNQIEKKQGDSSE